MVKWYMNLDINKRIDQMTNQELYNSLCNHDCLKLNDDPKDGHLVVEQINLELFIRAAGLREQL